MFITIHCMEKWYTSCEKQRTCFFPSGKKLFSLCSGYIDPGTLFLAHFYLDLMIEYYSKTCVKQPLKNRQNKDLIDKW